MCHVLELQRRRRNLKLAMVCACCAVPRAIAAQDLPAETKPGEGFAQRVIESRCAFCHSQSLTVRFLNRFVTEHGFTEIDTFLASHHVPDAEAREAILLYLEQLTNE